MSFQDRVEANLGEGVQLFRDAPPKGFRGVKHVATIINVARKMEAEFNAYIRELAYQNSELASQVAKLARELHLAKTLLYRAEVRWNAAGLDLTKQQTEKLLGVEAAAA